MGTAPLFLGMPVTTRAYEIFYPELNTKVAFRVLSLDEISRIVDKRDNYDDDAYERIVIESTVYNLKSDVTAALKDTPKSKAVKFLRSLYNACVMLNPGLDIETWVNISYAGLIDVDVPAIRNRRRLPIVAATSKPKKLSKQKFLALGEHLKNRIVGQNEAIDEVLNSIRRSQVGLNDENRPLASFIFAGSSGVGKTETAKQINAAVFGNAEILRIDCGEYQQKHEAIKLLGAPNSYVGYDEGSFLTEALAKNPNTVVLFDEIEKAHPDLFNLMLPVLDEGYMTDAKGNRLDFRNCIIIMTTNLGNREITAEMDSPGVGFQRVVREVGAPPSRMAITNATMKAIKKHFRPEFLNRFDKIITFNYLVEADYIKIAELELELVQQKLDKRGFVLSYDASAPVAMVKDGIKHSQGARGLAQLRRDRIENHLAKMLMDGRFPRGTVFQLTHDAEDYRFIANRPAIKKRPATQPGSSQALA